MSRQTAIKSIFWLTFSEILFNLSGYIIHAVAGRVLGPADYGRYSLVITLTTVIVVLIGNGIPTAMSKYLSEVFEKDPQMVPVIKKQGIRLQLMLMGLVTIAFFLAAPLIAYALNDATLTPLFRLSSLIIPAFAAASFYFSYFTGLHRFDYQSTLKSFRSVMRIVVTVSFVVLFGLNGAILGYVIAPLLTFLLGLYLDKRLSDSAILKQAQGNDAPQADAREFPYRKLLLYAWPLTLFMLFYELFISIDLYLVKSILKDDVATGIYNAALTIGRIPYYLFYALSIFLLPALAKMNSEKDVAKMKTLMTQSLRYAGIILLPVFVLIFAYAEPITLLFFGNKFAAAAPVLRILTLGLSFLTVFYLICSALNGIGHATLSMRLAVIGTVASTALNYIFIQRYGLIGAAYATTLSAMITTLISLLISQRYIPITFHWNGILKTILSGGALWYAVLLFPAHDWRFIPYGIVFAALYIAALFFTGVITKEDVSRFRAKKSLA